MPVQGMSQLQVKKPAACRDETKHRRVGKEKKKIIKKKDIQNAARKDNATVLLYKSGLA